MNTLKIKGDEIFITTEEGEMTSVLIENEDWESLEEEEEEFWD